MRNFGVTPTDISTGEEISFWYSPISWASQKAGELWAGEEAVYNQQGGADAGVIGGSCTDLQGLLGPAGAKVSCADLRAAQDRAAGVTGTSYRSYTPIPDAPASKGSGSGDGTEKPTIPWWIYGGVAVSALVVSYGIYHRVSTMNKES